VPIYFKLIGGIGIFLTLLSGLVSLFFFRAYKFQEINHLKRQYSSYVLVQILARSLLVTLFYL
jgi:Ca2+/Na+ antiporter